MDLQSLKQFPSASGLSNDQLRALWHDLHGDWDTAHRIIQQLSDVHAMWIHAYLHRKEPDLSNARYWYRNAGQPFPEGQSFDEEAAVILAALSQL
jgi:hypothetical protein